MKEKDRNLGIDLFRVLCMTAIMAQHIIGHGWVMQLLNPMSWKYELVTMLHHACMFGLNGFALISGYVGVSSRYKYSSLAFQWTKVWFYSVALTGVMWMIAPQRVGQKEWLDALFPTIRAQYWYFSAYVGCFLFAPAIRMAIRRMELKQAAVFVALIAAVFSVCAQFAPGDSFGLDLGKGTLWLMIVYTIGAFFGWFRPHERMKMTTLWAIAAGAMLTLAGYETLINHLLQKASAGAAAFEHHSPRALLMAVSLLMLFSRLNIARGRKMISILGMASFGAYLIHDHPLVRSLVIGKYAPVLTELGTVGVPVGVVLSAVVLYLVCTLLEVLREKLFAALRIRQRLAAAEEKLCANLWAD